MTAQRGTPSVQEKKKKQRLEQSKEDSTRLQPIPTTSSQRLRDLASQASSPKENHKRQVYQLRSTASDYEKNAALSLRPAYLAQSPSPLNPTMTTVRTAEASDREKSRDDSGSSGLNLVPTLQGLEDNPTSGSNTTDASTDPPPPPNPPPPPPPTQEVIRLADGQTRQPGRCQGHNKYDG